MIPHCGSSSLTGPGDMKGSLGQWNMSDVNWNIRRLKDAGRKVPPRPRAEAKPAAGKKAQKGKATKKAKRLTTKRTKPAAEPESTPADPAAPAPELEGAAA